MKRTLLLLTLVSLGGCGGPISPSGGETIDSASATPGTASHRAVVISERAPSTGSGQALRLGRCDGVRLTGSISVEDVAGTDLVVVRLDGQPVCVDQLVRTPAAPSGDRPIVVVGRTGSTGAAGSDPMPADGEHEGPESGGGGGGGGTTTTGGGSGGTGPGGSDPMPANGK